MIAEDEEDTTTSLGGSSSTLSSSFFTLPAGGNTDDDDDAENTVAFIIATAVICNSTVRIQPPASCFSRLQLLRVLFFDLCLCVYFFIIKKIIEFRISKNCYIIFKNKNKSQIKK